MTENQNIDEEKYEPWMQSNSGNKVHILNIRPEEIQIIDIAHALALQVRYGGHCPEFYSIAEHSIWVSILCGQAEGKEAALWGLLHDASEAYLGDIPRPIKYQPEFEQYRVIEEKVQTVIYTKYGLIGKPPAIVKHFDNRMLITEANQFYKGTPLRKAWKDQGDSLENMPTLPTMSWREAQEKFLTRFTQLI